jgi:hypothetical protein
MATQNTGWGLLAVARRAQERELRSRSEHDQEDLEGASIKPAPLRRRQYSWATFIKEHLSAIRAADFFTVEVLSWVGLVRYHVFFVMDLARRRVEIAGIALSRRPVDGAGGAEPSRRR